MTNLNQIVELKYNQFVACHLYLTKALKIQFKIKSSISYNSGKSVWQSYNDFTISFLTPWEKHFV